METNIAGEISLIEDVRRLEMALICDTGHEGVGKVVSGEYRRLNLKV